MAAGCAGPYRQGRRRGSDPPWRRPHAPKRRRQAPKTRSRRRRSSASRESAEGRMRDIMLSLTRHLHGFIREIEPTEEEWLAAIRFLTETGQKCDERRQEFILLSDTLGASMLIDAINNRKPQRCDREQRARPVLSGGRAGLREWRGPGGRDDRRRARAGLRQGGRSRWRADPGCRARYLADRARCRLRGAGPGGVVQPVRPYHDRRRRPLQVPHAQAP